MGISRVKPSRETPVRHSVPLIDLLLALHGWRIMVSLVLLLATLQVLKLLYDKVHIFS